MLLGLPVADDYVPSEGELDNLIYLTLKYGVGWAMRAADKAVCLMLAGYELRGDAGISKLVETVCEYAWDHLAGEPAETSPAQVFEALKPMLQTWYSQTTPAERASTS